MSLIWEPPTFDHDPLLSPLRSHTSFLVDINVEILKVGTKQVGCENN